MSGLPEYWLTIKLSEDVTYKKGKKPKLLFLEKNNDELEPYIDIKAFEKGIIRKYAKSEDGIKAFSDDTLMVWDGARSGLVGNGIKGIIGSTLMRITPVCSNKKYFHFFLESQYGNINSRTKGMGIPHVDPAVLWNIPYPLAPLNEQIRIANKLDSLLGKLQATQKRLDKIPTLLKRYRQSVLAAAVSGELTKEWREENSTQWTILTIQEVAEVKGGKRLPKGEKLVEVDTGFPYIRAGQLKLGTVIHTNEPRSRQLFLTPDVQAKISRYIVNKGDVYITIVGASIGDSGVIPENYQGANLTENAAKITDFKKPLISKFLAFWLQSQELQDLIKFEIKSGAQGKLALKRIKELPVPYTNIKEQKQIVKRVEALFKLADQAEQHYQAAKQRTDKLTQSILAKAFRGELVPQDPNDEPASELLARIQAEKDK